MLKLYTFTTIISLLLSGSVLATDHEKIEKRIIISTHGESANMAEIMKQVEAEIEGDDNLIVFATIDDDGKVNVTKSGAVIGAPHEMMKMGGHHGVMAMSGTAMMPGIPGVPGVSGIHGIASLSGFHGPMNAGTANCVLRNISKAQSDTAAGLIKQACDALNQSDEE
jgi:hypothetical protein